MGRKIIVAGAGHGATMAAAQIAKAGFDVTVYERHSRDNMGWNWFDCMNPEIFHMVGAPHPEEVGLPWAWRNDISFYGPSTDKEHSIFQRLKFPEETEIIMDRKDLYTLMIDYAESVGVKFEFDCNVLGPIMAGDRVIGIHTEKGDFCGDLVIDGAGMFSPVRMNLPDILGIQQNVNRGEWVRTFRGYYNLGVDKDSVKPEDKYRCMFKRDPGAFNFSWTDVVEDFSGRVGQDFCDVLIADIDELTMDDVNARCNEYRKWIPELGTELIHAGQIVPITLRQPLGLMVADGYCAIGDSAHMSMNLNGSGISDGFEVSKILADAVINEKTETFSAETLWPYMYNFWKKMGWGLAPIAIVKLFIFNLTREQIDYAFNEGIITWREFSVTADQHMITQFLHWDPNLPKRGLAILKNPGMLMKAAGAIGDAIQFFCLEAMLPKEYSRSKAQAWAKAYNKIFERHLPK